MTTPPQLPESIERKLRLLIDENIENMESYVEEDGKLLYSDALFCRLFDQLRPFIAQQLQTQREELEREKLEMLEALCDMWEQYCPPPYTHAFMSAGEGTEVVLDKYGLLKKDRTVDWEKLKSLSTTRGEGEK